VQDEQSFYIRLFQPAYQTWKRKKCKELSGEGSSDQVSGIKE